MDRLLFRVLVLSVTSLGSTGIAQEVSAEAEQPPQQVQEKKRETMSHYSSTSPYAPWVVLGVLAIGGVIAALAASNHSSSP
jgi:hypothetical protein